MVGAKEGKTGEQTPLQEDRARLLIKSIYLKNFCSFKGELTFSPRGRVIWITGINLDSLGANSNGAGKTSLLLTIPWALYGQTPTGAWKDSMIHGQERDCLVRLDLGDLIVERSKERGAPENLKYYWRGKWVEGSLRAVQYTLIDLLDLPWRTFCNSVWIGPETGAMQILTATPKDRMALMERFIGSERMEGARKHASRMLRALKEERASQETHARLLTEQLKEAELRAVSLNSEIAKRGEELCRRAARSRRETRSLYAELKEVERHISMHTAMSITDLHEEEQKIRVRLRSLEGNRCPTCNQPWLEPHLLKEKEELTLRMHEILEKKGEARNEEKIRRELLKRKDGILKSITALRETETDELLDRMHEEEQEVRDRSARLRRALEDGKAGLQSTDELIHTYMFWMEGFGPRGIKNMMMNTVRLIYSTMANHYLHTLTEGGLTFVMPPTASRFLILVEDGKGRTRGLQSYSTGERERIKLSLLWGLRDVAQMRQVGKLGFVILDDPLAHLDREGQEHVRAAVEKLASNCPQILITVPTEDIDGDVVIERRGGASSLKRGEICH